MMFLVYCIASKDAYEGTPFLKRLWQTRVVLTRNIAAVAVGFRDFSIIIHPSQCPGHSHIRIAETKRQGYTYPRVRQHESGGKRGKLLRYELQRGTTR